MKIWGKINKKNEKEEKNQEKEKQCLFLLVQSILW
jgi:hypothetical protein